MARGRNQGKEQPDLTIILANIQQRLGEQATIIQQQSVIIQNIQQQQNGGPGNGGNGNREHGNGEVSNSRIGDGGSDNGRSGNEKIPGGHRPEGNQQQGVVGHENLYKRFSGMKPLVFEGSNNPLDAEE